MSSVLVHVIAPTGEDKLEGPHYVIISKHLLSLISHLHFDFTQDWKSSLHFNEES